MIYHEQPGDPWTPFDFKLLEAYQILQDETCPRCGHPVWLCRSKSNRVEFKAEEGYCSGERAVEERKDASRDKKNRADKETRKSWGQFFYSTPFTPENVEGGLPTRSEYYKDLGVSE